MLQLLAWVSGLLNSIATNAPYLEAFGGEAFVWWQGVVFALLLYPAAWLLGIILPRLTLAFASGATVGGAVSSAIALFTWNPDFLPGSLLTCLIGYLTTAGQRTRVGG